MTALGLLDVINRQLYVFRELTASGYASQVILTEPASIKLLAFPDVSLLLQNMLPPLPTREAQ